HSQGKDGRPKQEKEIKFMKNQTPLTKSISPVRDSLKRSSRHCGTVRRSAAMSHTSLVCTLLGLLPVFASSAEAQSHFVRLGDIGTGTVRHICAAGLGDERVVTAADDAAGNLKLIVWDVTSDGKFTRQGSIEAGKTSVFALATLGTTDAITAVRKEDGDLR